MWDFLIIWITGFPATCPYVTVVGATQINPGSNVTQPESACEQAIFSGGGFSNQFAMPAYQKRVVHQYLKKYKPDYSADIWNSTGIVRELPLFSPPFVRNDRYGDRVVVIQTYPRMGMVFDWIIITSDTWDLTYLLFPVRIMSLLCVWRLML